MFLIKTKSAVKGIFSILIIFLVGIIGTISYSSAKIFKKEFDNLYKQKFNSDTITEIKPRTLADGAFRFHFIFRSNKDKEFFPAIKTNKKPPYYDWLKVGDILIKKANATKVIVIHDGEKLTYNFVPPGPTIGFMHEFIFIEIIFAIIGLILLQVLPYRWIEKIFLLRK